MQKQFLDNLTTPILNAINQYLQTHPKPQMKKGQHWQLCKYKQYQSYQPNNKKQFRMMIAIELGRDQKFIFDRFRRKIAYLKPNQLLEYIQNDSPITFYKNLTQQQNQPIIKVHQGITNILLKKVQLYSNSHSNNQQTKYVSSSTVDTHQKHQTNNYIKQQINLYKQLCENKYIIQKYQNNPQKYQKYRWSQNQDQHLIQCMDNLLSAITNLIDQKGLRCILLRLKYLKYKMEDSHYSYLLKFYFLHQQTVI